LRRASQRETQSKSERKKTGNGARDYMEVSKRWRNYGESTGRRRNKRNEN
jgi:hypothetical protein